jgi:G patch domain-containing protein 1
LGYVPGLSLDESLGTNATEDSKGHNLAGVIVNLLSFFSSINLLIGGFGLGALNDADEDDLDVYDSVQKHSRRRLAYDHLSGEGDDTIVVGGRSDKQKTSIPVSVQVFEPSSLVVDILKRSSPTALYFLDGRPLISGFVLSEERVVEDRW